jgi:hypothetical protein
MDGQELAALLSDRESDRVERKTAAPFPAGVD